MQLLFSLIFGGSKLSHQSRIRTIRYHFTLSDDGECSQSQVFSMFRIVICLAMILSVGCTQHRYEVADPVVGPAPPRKQSLESVAYDSETMGEVQLASYTADEPIPSTEVVAWVNGTPVLAGLVLEPFAAKLAQASKQLPPSEIRKAQEMLLKQNLPAQIEQTLMVSAVKSKLEVEQYDLINEQLDEFFEQEVERLKGQLGVSNLAELEGKLQTQGMSLVTMREMFGNRQLATEYLRGKMGEGSPLTRQDLLTEYNRRREEYAQPEQVTWQQIQISISKHGSEIAARAVLNQAITELRQGVDFSDVVKRYSDGPLKDKGGHWDWTQPSSIANPKVRDTLAQLQMGQLSPAVNTGNALQIVKVTGRKPATYTPFDEVQETIRKELINNEREQRAQQIVDELKAEAVIETIFDDDFSKSKSIIR